MELLLDLLVEPSLEPWMVNKVSHCLATLLKKRELLDRQDLTVQWRPLYQLHERLFYSPYEALGMVTYPQ